MKITTSVRLDQESLDRASKLATAMGGATGVPITRSRVLELGLVEGLAALERKQARGSQGAREVAVRPTVEVSQAARGGSQAARDARAAERRARKAALGCSCPGGHREGCPLRGVPSEEVEARLAGVELGG